MITGYILVLILSMQPNPTFALLHVYDTAEDCNKGLESLYKTRPESVGEVGCMALASEVI